MDTPITVAAISAAAAAVVAPAISFYLTKKKEREADWQKCKFEQYREFGTALGGIVGTDATPEGTRRFAVSCNTLHLIASQPVITALHAYQDEIRESNTDKSRTRHDALLSRLIWEIRQDLELPGNPAVGEFVAGLWSSGEFSLQKSEDDAPRVGNKAAEELRVRDPGITSVIEKSGLTQPGEHIRRTLLLFQTAKQRTWLAASNERLFCVLDDQKTRASGKLIQWILHRDEATQIKVRPRGAVGTVDIGPRKSWYYSTDLHTSPEELKERIQDLLTP
jgi:hypothetical protein